MIAFDFCTLFGGSAWLFISPVTPPFNIAVNISASAVAADHFPLSGEVFEGETAVTTTGHILFFEIPY